MRIRIFLGVVAVWAVVQLLVLLACLPAGAQGNGPVGGPGLGSFAGWWMEKLPEVMEAIDGLELSAHDTQTVKFLVLETAHQAWAEGGREGEFRGWVECWEAVLDCLDDVFLTNEDD